MNNTAASTVDMDAVINLFYSLIIIKLTSVADILYLLVYFNVNVSDNMVRI